VQGLNLSAHNTSLTFQGSTAKSGYLLSKFFHAAPSNG